MLNMKCHKGCRIFKNSLKKDDRSRELIIDVQFEAISKCFEKAGFDQFSEDKEDDEISFRSLREYLKKINEDVQLQIKIKVNRNKKCSIDVQPFLNFLKKLVLISTLKISKIMKLF